LRINIPEFIRLLREGDVSRAYEVIKERNPLPSICGRICSAPCEAACILTEEDAPIGIRGLERYVSDNVRLRPTKQEVREGKKIAVIGSGPAGLAAASHLASKGFRVTIFESLDKPGGILRYGIPEFRIPKKILDSEIENLKTFGVEIKTNVYIGQTMTLEDLKQEGFNTILLAVGAGIPKFMNLPGTNLGGVYYGEEFLMRVNLTKGNIFSKQTPKFVMGKKVAVIGSGNTALDCARCALRFDREVMLIFRRTEEDMRVRKDERELALEEGIHFESLVKPVEIISNQNNFVEGIKCLRMDYADPEGMGDWRLMPVPDSEFILDVDTVVIAVGHNPNSVVGRLFPDLALNKDGTIKINTQDLMTSIPAVFACGNVVTNAGPVVEAMASGQEAAEEIEKYLTG